jgi:hypothetical protein
MEFDRGERVRVQADDDRELCLSGVLQRVRMATVTNSYNAETMTYSSLDSVGFAFHHC